MRDFQIKRKYITGVDTKTPCASPFGGTSFLLGNDDHPKFKELREELDSSGYIEKDDTCWNRDVVKKAFSVNGTLYFWPGEKFSCASALDADLNIMEKYGIKPDSTPRVVPDEW